MPTTRENRSAGGALPALRSVAGARARTWVLWVGLGLCTLAEPADAARLALVIGNRDYSVGVLKNPINDAAAMVAALRGLGFEVTPVTNLKRDDIGRTVEGFASRIRPGDDVVVFYAGHGVQLKGVNYLPAVDAKITFDSDVALNSINLNQLLDRLDEAKAGVRLLLIDACRDNPYSRARGSRGLARVETPPSGTLMHFATRPGSVADDGSGSNGLYTSHLLKNLATPGLPVESMLKRVAAGVKDESRGAQQPWTEGQLEGEFYFAQLPVPPAPVVPQASSRPEPVTAARQVPVPEPALNAGSSLKDCDDCPTLVVLPVGSYRMGSPDTEKDRGADEGPVHEVRIGYRLAVGKYELTRGEFARFVAAAGYKTEAERSQGCATWSGGKWEYSAERNWRNPGFAQADSHPVVCVSWNDAQAYLDWLNKKVPGKGFRLLSEAEWEFAARAGQGAKRYPWGDDANASDLCTWANGLDATAKAHPS